MPRVLGIDLGTTNSAMAVITAGDPEIIENADGRRTTPSVVGLSSKTNERLIGETAKRQAVTDPENTVFSAKRFIGRRFQDDEVQRDKSRVPFDVRALGNGDAGIVFDGETRSPSEISSMVLRKLKEDAEARLDERITQAVITVPAYFNDAQREATKVAGTIAGLDVLRIVNEPTAAALAFGAENKGDRTVAVYDLGGGTFDVTILSVKDGLYEVLSTSGDTHLGGDDFDTRIVDHLSKSMHGRGVTDRSLLSRLRDAAEKAKIDLSTQSSTEVIVPYISGNQHLEETLDRGTLERLVDDLIERTVGPCKRALEDAHLSAGDIDEVLLVGGMTRMPAVQRRAQEIFGRQPVRTINPDEVVAMGAALQAGVLQGEVTDIVLLDVTPLSLGTQMMGDIFGKVIERNTTIPATGSSVRVTVADGQTEILFRIYQGEREMASDNVKLGEFMVDGIPRAPRGESKVELTFDIDADGILTVSAVDLATHREHRITVSGRSGISQDEIDRLIAESEYNAERDRFRRELAEARNDADMAVYRAEKLLKDSGDRLSWEVKREFYDKVDAVKSAMVDDRVGRERLWQLMNELDSLRMRLG